MCAFLICSRCARLEWQMPSVGWSSGLRGSDSPFFALVPDASAASRLTGIGRALRLKHGLTGKLLAAEQLHLPLIGLGAHADLPPESIDLAMQAAAAINMASFDVVLDRAGSLAGLRRPLVITGDEGVRGARVLQLMLDI